MSQPIGTNSSKWIRDAITFFESLRYRPTEEELKKLSLNLRLLQEVGLSHLNRRLIEGGRKSWDTLVEHNFAVDLISAQPPNISIEYEPSTRYKRPPDFVIALDNVTYFVQVKSVASLERENRQRKITERLKSLTRRIQIPKFFGIKFSTKFTEGDLTELIEFIAQKALEAIEDVEYLFPDAHSIKAMVYYWLPATLELSHLTLGSAGDMNMVNETGLAVAQIRQSLTNSAGAFTWDAATENINIIAMDANRYNDIDICDALFGTEYEIGTDAEKKMN